MGRTFDNTGAGPTMGFWRRQFAADSTPTQDRFDLWFGVALPVACFVFDPLIFKGDILDGPLLGEYRLFAYLVSVIQIGMFLCWFSFRRDLETFAAPFAGVFVAGGIFSTMIGILILPFSMLGLMFVIGLAGFTPFFTGFVYLRTGVRAMRVQLNNSTFAFRYLIAMLAAFVAFAFPLFWNSYFQERVPPTVIVDRRFE